MNLNPLIERQLAELRNGHPDAGATLLPSGAHLITVSDVSLPAGWDRITTTILFVAPPGYPAAAPDCFWVVPGQMRLQNGGTPQGSNDSNLIPELAPIPQATWFSWHVQAWNPNHDSLLTYLNVIGRRFHDLQ